MELERKFIKGTDKRYSIREDGAVFSHYRNGQEKKSPKSIIYDVIQLKIKNGRVSVNNKTKSIKILIFQHFGYCICIKCDKKMNYINQARICKECRKIAKSKDFKKYYEINKEKRRVVQKIWEKNNVDIIKAKVKIRNKRNIEKVSKAYVATFLQLPSKEMSNELYNNYRDLLLFKRQVAKEHNISVQKIR